MLLSKVTCEGYILRLLVLKGFPYQFSRPKRDILKSVFNPSLRYLILLSVGSLALLEGMSVISPDDSTDKCSEMSQACARIRFPFFSNLGYL